MKILEYFAIISMNDNARLRLTQTSRRKQELIRRWDSERELFLQHRTCRGQRLRPL